jgi:F-type H+-transporting ATPase subunit c
LKVKNLLKIKNVNLKEVFSFIIIYSLELDAIKKKYKKNIMLAAAKYIGAGLACSGLIGAGAGIGLIFSSLIASTARNPQIRGQLFSFAILGFALAEATGLFSLMIAFLLLYS